MARGKTFSWLGRRSVGVVREGEEWGAGRDDKGDEG